MKDNLLQYNPSIIENGPIVIKKTLDSYDEDFESTIIRWFDSRLFVITYPN